MKSLDFQDRNIRSFWNWFAEIATDLAADPQNENLHRQLDAKVRLLNPDITWEIGPGTSAEWLLAISPDLDASLLPVTRQIVSLAPPIDGWEFHWARQPKQWNYQFDIVREVGQVVRIDARKWKYVLLRYPNGSCEIVLIGDAIESLSKSDRERAAAILVQGILGEEFLITEDVSFDLTDSIDEQFRGKEKSIANLAEAFGKS
jgi:hypothetical protein